MKLIKSVRNRVLSLLVGLGIVACGPIAPLKEDLGALVFKDDFDTDGPLKEYTVNNANAHDAIAAKGRYYAPILSNNNDITLHFNKKQGRLDAIKVSFPFTLIARNIGIGLLDDTQTMPSYANEPYIFAGIQVHTADLNELTSAHVVVGHRGNTYNTVEGKNTINGYSWVTDVGADTALNGRADLLIQGLPDKTLKVFWQPANTTRAKDRWIPYAGRGRLPGDSPNFTDKVYVGFITYAAGQTGLPFAGTADSFEIYQN